MYKVRTLMVVPLLATTTFGASIAAAPGAEGAIYPTCEGPGDQDGRSHQGSISVPVVQTPWTFNCNLRYGNVSNAVLALQKAFKYCYNSKVTLDGIYGPYTEGAMEAVQRLHGATIDGVYGPETRWKMRFKKYWSDDCDYASE